MIPSSVAAVTIFVLALLPGLLLERLRQRHRPAFDRTALEEVAAVLFAGLAITGTALGIMGIVRLVLPGWMPDLGGWLAHEGYASQHYRLVIRTAVVEVFLAVLIVVVVERSLNHPTEKGVATRVADLGKKFLRETDSHIEPYPIWWVVFRGFAGKDRIAVVSARLKDGRTITGQAAVYTIQAEGDQRDLVLQTPVQFVGPGGAVDVLDHADPGKWRLVVVSASEIVEMAVRYDLMAPEVVPGNQGMRSRRG